MRLQKKIQIQSVMDTVCQALEYTLTKTLSVEIEQQLREDCIYAIDEIINMLAHEDDEKIKEIVLQLEKVNLEIGHHSGDINKILQIMFWQKNAIESKIDVKIKIAFLPYKYSMWDSLNSIWKQAMEDEKCICDLVPIPYFEKDKYGNAIKKCYEIEQFPKEAMEYKDYNFQDEHPDIIYIHNPYDNNNAVTSIHPDFYSDKLKKYTEMLVYIPYYIAGLTSTYEAMANSLRLPGCYNADKIIVQSKELRKCFLKTGIENEKVLALGSPKIDQVLAANDSIRVPKEWEEIFQDKTVILINGSINGALQISTYLDDMLNIIKEISQSENKSFIWRPHPLMLATLQTMREDDIKVYNEIIQQVQELKKGVIDLEPDTTVAFKCSHALISDYSSLLMQYTFTGKPTLVLNGTVKSKKLIVLCDYFDNYFMYDGTSIQEFFDIIENENSTKKEQRIKRAKASLENANGRCGEIIYSTIIKCLLEKPMDV